MSGKLSGSAPDSLRTDVQAALQHRCDANLANSIAATLIESHGRKMLTEYCLIVAEDMSMGRAEKDGMLLGTLTGLGFDSFEEIMAAGLVMGMAAYMEDQDEDDMMFWDDEDDEDEDFSDFGAFGAWDGDELL